MKPLELTSEHREKLLEMFKNLFPEYRIQLSYVDGYYCAPGDLDFYNILKKKGDDTYGHGTDIHWFEFCINWLATRIYNLRQPSTTITLFRGHLTQDVDHPVDYLYEQFKKIK